ncbi:hypothetical protein [Gordonia sp. C13]|uniref:hypothetical protein n=1 Tax=Gordonia sp. C13 TaxID=2935078 RepID=UPI00200AEC33|nr:hypothetical protein [Gordonia sp. C13]MCK8615957.1 hypothetical protein [Gordonia sp. C13]
MTITDTAAGQDSTLAGTDTLIPELLPLDSADAVATNARRLLGLVADEADEMEQIARLTPRLATAFRRAGLFQMAFPAFRGGLEMSLRRQLDVVADVATVDASAAWNVAVLNATGFYAARLDDEAYAELYPTRDMPTSGSFHPRGRAQLVPGGYLVSGRWDWGSGSYTAEHVIGSANVFDGDQPVIGPSGTQLHLGIWLPREAVTASDNWQVLGVRGSGSTSYVITEPAFVPASHSFDRDARYDQTKDPLNRSVHLSHFALTGVALGVARHLVEITADIISARGVAHLDAAMLQRFGEAVTEVDFAYAGSRTVADITDDIIFSDNVLTPAAQARMTAVNAFAGLALRRVVDITTDLARAGFIRDVDPMQRVLRDAYGALSHAGTRRDHLGALARAGLSSGGVDTSGAAPVERARELFAERA